MYVGGRRARRPPRGAFVFAPRDVGVSATLRVLGAGPRLVSAVPVPGAAAAVAAGVAGAVGVAVVLSPLAPIGPLRRVEVDPGLSFDWVALVSGAAGFAVVLGAVVFAAAVRQAPHRRQARARMATARRSTLVGAVSAAGLPLPAVTGMRLALEAGEGRTSVPVRAALGGAVVAVVALVASLVFGTSLRSLVEEPHLYGWDWDLTVLDEAGYGDIDVARAGELLDGDQAVEAWTGVYFQSVDLDGRDVPVIGIQPGAPVTPPILSGRPVRGPDEVVLGRATLAALGKRVGDTVVLAGREEAQQLRVVGTAVFPTVRPILGAYTSLGEGAMMIHDRIPGWDEISPGAQGALRPLRTRRRPGGGHRPDRRGVAGDQQARGHGPAAAGAAPGGDRELRLHGGDARSPGRRAGPGRGGVPGPDPGVGRGPPASRPGDPEVARVHPSTGVSHGRVAVVDHRGRRPDRRRASGHRPGTVALDPLRRAPARAGPPGGAGPGPGRPGRRPPGHRQPGRRRALSVETYPDPEVDFGSSSPEDQAKGFRQYAG